MSSLIRMFVLAALSVTVGCERQTYTCCVDGYVETCTCPRRDLCMVPYVRANADGTCDEGAPGDTSGGGEGVDSGAGATSL